MEQNEEEFEEFEALTQPLSIASIWKNRMMIVRFSNAYFENYLYCQHIF